MLDPVADKALLVTMYLTLAAVESCRTGWPSWWCSAIVLIVGGVIVLAVLGQPVRSGRCISRS